MKRRDFLIGSALFVAGCDILPKVQDPTTLYSLTPNGPVDAIAEFSLGNGTLKIVITDLL